MREDELSNSRKQITIQGNGLSNSKEQIAIQENGVVELSNLREQIANPWEWITNPWEQIAQFNYITIYLWFL